MGKRMKKAVTVLLAVSLLVGVVMAVWQFFGYTRARESQEYARQVAFSQEYTVLPETVPPLAAVPDAEVPAEPLPEEAAFLLGLDLPSLRKINEEVLGWFYIPGTGVSYPLMETDSRDEYLTKGWEGGYNPAGSIFMESRSSRDLSDFNTILYGHHMADGSMFGTLPKYADPEYGQAHRDVYVATAGSILRYQVFAAWEAPVDGDAYRLVFADDAQKQAALNTYLESALWDSGVTPTAQDRILTLSTCMGLGTYHTRWVVQAVLVGQWER